MYSFICRGIILKKLLMFLSIVSLLNANEFRKGQKIDEIDVFYSDIKYLCIGGTLSFIRPTVHNNFIIKSVENPRTRESYKCELILDDPYTNGKRLIEIKD